MGSAYSTYRTAESAYRILGGKLEVKELLERHRPLYGG
jgi:hypothetical protein